MNQNSKIIIGIHCGHDSSVVILKAGVNIFSISEERITRIKGYTGVPFLSIAYIFEQNIVSPNDVVEIALCNTSFAPCFAKSNLTFLRRLKGKKTFYENLLETLVKNNIEFPKQFLSIINKNYDGVYVLAKKSFEAMGCKNINVSRYDHHKAHAASAYYGAGFDQSLVITSDGFGDGLSGSISLGENGKMEKLYSVDDNLSIGGVYSAVTTKSGFILDKHEGKITGLSAYGNPDILKEYFKTILHHKNGEIKSNMPYPKFKQGFTGIVSDSLEFGIIKFLRWRLYRFIQRKIKKRVGFGFTDIEFYFFDKKASNKDLSASVQDFAENIISDWINHWVQKTGVKKVVLAGGVFANVKINQRIMERCEVSDIFVYPNMGDGRLAYGCASLKYHEDNIYEPEIIGTKTMYLGTEYSDAKILQCLKQNSNISFNKSNDIAKDVAQIISDRKIVGWFQGRMEFGPRALGARSIVAMPDDPTINDWLNERMQRTEFMPFAPSVLEEHMDDIFEIPHEKFKRPAEYMTITYNVKKKWQDKIGAVNHIDNTARPQMVTKDTNPLYYDLIENVYKLTGLPLVINTSFNVHEEPIVMTPDDALNSLYRGMIDVLAIGNYIVKIKN